MKLLIILCSHEMNIKDCGNIKILNDYIKSSDIEVEYCGISNQDDFHNYETIIQWKYKIINEKRQLSKVCDFITDYKSELSYDWYMKIRPDIKLLENINFELLSENAINARARVYYGPKKLKYGMSVNGVGKYRHIGDCHYSDIEKDIVLDDMLFIFHNNIVQLNAFDKINVLSDTAGWDEWKQTGVFNARNIPLNCIGIHVENTKHNIFSGHINMT